MSTKKETPISIQLAVISVARLILNIGLRMVYPFAPALARGLNVPLTAVYRLVTLRNFAGFLSPAFTPLSERFGRRKVMAASLVLLGASGVIMLIWPSFITLGITLALVAIAKVIYDPAMQAYVGDKVPYQRRGRAFAVTELSWAGALLLGAPAVGILIAAQGWRAPFVWLGALGMITAVILYRLLPKSSRQSHSAVTFKQVVAVVRAHPVIWAASTYILLIMAANEILFIVYGGWMESSFDLSLASLGVASSVVGGAEVLGELFVGLAVDRLGKRPVILVTGMLTAVFYALIPFIGNTLTSALITLFILFLFFEITVVGGIPLMTELVPKSRTVVMAMVLAFGALGRALGSLIGPLIWQMGGLRANGLLAALIMLIAVAVLARWVKEMELL